MKNIIIDAIITTVQPLSITMPVAEGGRANVFNNFPVTAVGQDSEGKLIETGYLPASTVRGFLRRSNGLTAAGKRGTSTLQQMYSDILGQRSDTKDEADLQKLEALRTNDAILDLYGSWGVRSRLLVSNFVPAHPVLPSVFTGTRRGLEATLGALECLSEEDREAYFNRADITTNRSAAGAVLKQLKRDYMKAKKDGKDLVAIEAAIKAQDDVVAGFTEQMGDMKNSDKQLPTFYYLPAGIQLKGKIVIERAKERDLEMILSALNDLSLRPVLGAQVARGCGEVAATFTVKVDGVVKQIVTVGGWEPARVADFAVVEAAESVA